MNNMIKYKTCAIISIKKYIFLKKKKKKRTWVRSLGWENPPGEGNGYPLQYSYLENPMDRGAWRAIVHKVAKSWIRSSD